MTDIEHAASWPGGHRVAVSLTFDLDAEAGVLTGGEQHARRLTALSEGRYGVTRGLPRILALLQRHGIRATFFVPGYTAQLHPGAVAAILDGGHEVGHHGHLHLRSDLIGAGEQRAEIERGLEALAAAGAPRPAGYRSPAWEITPETLSLLVEHEFGYDSSCMGDDRPYLETWAGEQILELPVHWSLDDWPRFGWSIDHGGNVAHPGELLDSWYAEFCAARAEGRLVTYTMHPEVIGRAYRLAQLERLIEQMVEAGGAWFAPLAEIARHVAPWFPVSAP
ncbi:MAG TPA: polysaccharide deacetylase family protein [Streptosporangiaceae bacterium]|jgi:peptidoglycan/xylan/chitin deacetylase (PgdA/CDA1 family)